MISLLGLFSCTPICDTSEKEIEATVEDWPEDSVYTTHPDSVRDATHADSVRFGLIPN